MRRPPNRLLTISEAAGLLGVHPNTLRGWADKGLVNHVKLPSGYRRFTLDEIKRLRREMGIDAAEDSPPPAGSEHEDETD